MKERYVDLCNLPRLKVIAVYQDDALKYTGTYYIGEDGYINQSVEAYANGEVYVNNYDMSEWEYW